MGAWESVDTGQMNNGELLSACRVLFGPDVEINQDFLWYLQPEGAKSAYRKKARESHPDAHPWAVAERIQVLEHEFVRVSNAYQKLSSFLMQRPHTVSCSAAQPSNHPPRRPFAPQPSADRCRPPIKKTDHLLYKGPVPSIELKFGRYLYFRGLVSFQSVLQALSWQRDQRPAIGILARSWGWLDDSDVHTILQSEQVHGRFGDRAVKLGFLTAWQQQELLRHQQFSQERIGGYFIKQQNMTARAMDLLDQERYRHNLLVSGC